MGKHSDQITKLVKEGKIITSDLVEYNERMIDKHHKYQRAVNDWFNNFLSQL